MGPRQDRGTWARGQTLSHLAAAGWSIFCQHEAGGFLRQRQDREHGLGDNPTGRPGTAGPYAERPKAPGSVPGEGVTPENDGACMAGGCLLGPRHPGKGPASRRGAVRPATSPVPERPEQTTAPAQLVCVPGFGEACWQREGQTLAWPPPHSPALPADPVITVSQILLLEIHSQLNQKAQRAARRKGSGHTASFSGLPAAALGSGQHGLHPTQPPGWKVGGGAGRRQGLVPSRHHMG